MGHDDKPWRLIPSVIEHLRKNPKDADAWEVRELCERVQASPSAARSQEPVAWQIIGKQSGAVISITADTHEMQLAVEGGHLIRGLYTHPLALESATSPTKEIPAELFDGAAVYVELGTHSAIQPHQVSNVLDAVVKLIRKNHRA